MGVKTITPYQGAFLRLLPQGAAWNKSPSGTLGRLGGALSDSMGSANNIAMQLLRERFPSQSTMLLEDWEGFLGLPDCTGDTGTIYARQIAAANKMRMVGSLCRKFYEELAAQYGYTVKLTPSPDNQFITIVNVQDGFSYRNMTVLDNCLTPLRIYESGALECLLEKFKPAHQIYQFVYPESDEE